MNSAATPRKFQFIGGALCFDFCNTLGGKRGGTPREYLNSYGDFLSWFEQAGLLDKAEAEGLMRKAGRQPAEAAAVLARALELREAIYRMFAATREGKTPAREDLAILNRELAHGSGRLQVAVNRGQEGLSWEWADAAGALDQALGPIARSAADVLTWVDALGRVRRCEGDNCGWLFVDSSKNHSRRWCDMRDCGNRAKVRKHRLKHSTVRRPKSKP